MSRAIWVLILVVVVFGLTQWGVPMLLDRAVAQAISQQTGTVPGVGIVAVPVWTLKNGRFQTLEVHSGPGHIGYVQYHSGSLQWEDGGLDLGALLGNHRLIITQVGNLAMSLSFDSQGLSRLMARQLSGTLLSPQIQLSARQVALNTRLALNHVEIPVRTTGVLALGSQRQAVFFQPKTFDGNVIPFFTQIRVFDLAELHLPLRLYIRSLRIGSGTLEISVQNQP